MVLELQKGIILHLRIPPKATKFIAMGSSPLFYLPAIAGDIFLVGGLRPLKFSLIPDLSKQPFHFGSHTTFFLMRKNITCGFIRNELAVGFVHVHTVLA